uniref:SFRICE_034329 n=1 Tax=Spodoptera frugiperda TaxID=7108 RepID=A0A2H1WW51_SPOFR
MSTNYLASVPKLKGRENFDEWTFAVENVLVLEGMLHCVKPVVGKDIKPEDDMKARAKLCLTIDPALYVHIKTTKTSKELWDKLKSLFDDSGFSRKISLLRHLISIRRENCEDMTTYVTQIVETSQRLCGTGFEITDQWIGSLMLAGLPDKFTPMIMAIEHSGIAITADVIRTKILDSEPLELMGVTLKETQKNEAAFASKWAKSKPRAGNTDQSGNGRKSNSNVKVANKNNITCYKCKNTVRYSKDEWYVDSGASVHMTAVQGWLQDVSSPKTCSEIMIANNEKLQVVCRGSIEISTQQGYDITIKEVLCVPSLTTNLLSLSQMIKNNNSIMLYYRDRRGNKACKGYKGLFICMATRAVHLEAEAGIKSTKHHLKKVIGNSTLTFEEMTTVLSQIEACLNSRPLSYVEDQDKLIILTPGHFLVGEHLLFCHPISIMKGIDILLGADAYASIIKEGIVRSPTGTLIAQNTALGWILSGLVASSNDKEMQHLTKNISVSSRTLDT